MGNTDRKPRQEAPTGLPVRNPRQESPTGNFNRKPQIGNLPLKNLPEEKPATAKPPPETTMENLAHPETPPAPKPKSWTCPQLGFLNCGSTTNCPMPRHFPEQQPICKSPGDHRSPVSIPLLPPSQPDAAAPETVCHKKLRSLCGISFQIRRFLLFSACRLRLPRIRTQIGRPRPRLSHPPWQKTHL